MKRDPRCLLFLVAACLPATLSPQEEVKPTLVLEGHEADVYDLAFSPDGTKLATGSFDKMVKLWEVPAGKLIATLTGHQGKILSLAFSRDGRSILSGSEDKTVKLWDVPGAGMITLAGHGGAVGALALSADSNWLASAAADGTVRLWNRATGKEALKLGGDAGVLNALAFAPDLKHVASGGEDKILRLWDVSALTAPAPAAQPAAQAAEIVKQGAPWRFLKGQAEPPAEWRNPGFDASKWPEGPSGFGYSSSPEELATVGTKLDDMAGGSYLSLYIRAAFKLDDPKQVEKLGLQVIIDDGFVAYLNGQEVGRSNIEGSPPAFNAVAAASNEPMPVAIDLTPHIGKLVAGDNVLAIQGHNSAATSSDFVLTPVLSAAFKAKEEKKEPPKPEANLVKIEGSAGPILAVAWSPDSSLIAAGGQDKAVSIWKAADASAVKKLDQGGVVRGLAFVNPNLLAAAGEGGPIKLWNIGEGKVERQLEGHAGQVLALAIRADRAQLLSGGEDKTVRLWNLAEFKEVRTFAGHGAAVEAVAFGPDPKTLVSGGADKTLRVWNADDGKEVRKFDQPGEVRTVALAAGERYYAAGWSGEILEWRNVSTEAARTFTGHGGAVHAVAFAPDGSAIASAGADKTVRWWNPADGKEVRNINAHESSVYSIAYNHDGTLLASGGFDRMVKLWNPATGAEVKKLAGHGEGVFCLKFSADGQFLYSGSSDRTIRKWNVAEGKEVAVLEGHPGWVCGLAFLPGESALLSVDYGGNILSWNPADGKRLSHRKLLTPPKPPRETPSSTVVYDLALSPDGKWIGTANLAGTVFLVAAQ